MVSNVTSLTGNGLKDWLIQRVTSIYFAAYALFLIAYLVLHPQLQFVQWYSLFANVWFQIASTIAILAFTLHAWIGLWTVLTDYMKCTALRISFLLLILLGLLGQFIWALTIVWGV